MIILLDTATPVCRFLVIDGDQQYDFEWEANRELAKGLLGFIETSLSQRGKDFTNITGIGVLRGPGSFTGLRIGITVANSLADALSVAVVGEMGDAWQSEAAARLQNGDNDRIVMPFYGGEANITAPRK